MTTFNLDKTANDCQENHSGSVRAQPSQTSPQIRANTVHFDDQNDTCSTRTPVPTPEHAPNTTVYEGYKFFKADPIPGQKATWTRVERTKMHLDQSEFYKMVQKRANKVSAARQYQNLSDTRRAHVNQLIHEQRRSDPNVEWSCVYAKERDRPAKARNAHRNDYETVSMDIILMKRPMRTKSYPRTPMGDLVDLGIPLRLDGDELLETPRRLELVSQERPLELSGPQFVPSNMWQQKDRPACSVPSVMPGHVAQEPIPHSVSVTTPFTRLDLSQSSAPETFGGNARFLHENACDGQTNVDKDGGWSSEASSGEDDDFMIFDQSQSDASSAIEHTENMDCDCPEPLTPQETTYQSRSRSPAHRDANHGSHYRKKSRGRHMERKERYYAWRHYHIDMKGVKNILPVMRARGPPAGNADPKLWDKRYRIQRMDDEEVRSRLIDCEARIEQWERAFEHQTRLLQQNIEELRQLKRSRSFWDFAQVPTHCGCDFPKDGHDE
ncbi:uncharacterized protein N7477_003379 [Penicillium maclennaniae]|uniref:uncharacterized protein n=1 Tax=Penicillium maclennaniae TaxID=1343394 RepID=UPI00253F68F4|nr:uncharacterized protein N7477_003379 [Penicillium maclennaniae]KAJ5677746.1 hypothetical protein N7477_003379 [Penicillium maclennaniae]